MRSWKTISVGLLALSMAGGISVAADETPSHLWTQEVEARLQEAGTNRSELVQAFRNAPADRREGLSFLVGNMPGSDLKSL